MQSPKPCRPRAGIMSAAGRTLTLKANVKMRPGQCIRREGHRATLTAGSCYTVNAGAWSAARPNPLLQRSPAKAPGRRGLELYPLGQQGKSDECRTAHEAVETATLWRSVGPEELDLIRASGMRTFPPRLPGQPILYPVLSEDYASKIARDWKRGASGPRLRHALPRGEAVPRRLSSPRGRRPRPPGILDHRRRPSRFQRRHRRQDRGVAEYGQGATYRTRRGFM